MVAVHAAELRESAREVLFWHKAGGEKIFEHLQEGKGGGGEGRGF
jgi:hypothetical protein